MAQVAKKRMQDIFHNSQFSLTSHEKLLKQLKKLYNEVPEDVFLSGFVNNLQVPLIHGEKFRVVENTLNFASRFICSLMQAKPADEVQADDEEEICPFVLNVLKFLFDNHNTEHQAIRFRVCQFINKILNGLGNEASMDDKLCDAISECMMERLQDKAPAVRMQAVLALHRLQDPYDPKCPVMKAFLFHMSSDPSADVRRAVITNIAVTASSVRAILERTNDLKDTVRRTAYVGLAKFGVQRFTIIQRVRLLTDGLKDTSVIVRDCVSKVMLPAWLTYYKGSFLSLLHALDCENSTDVSTLALESLFKSEPIKTVLEELTRLLNEDKVIPVDKLTPENVLYWRVLSKYLETHPEIADSCPIDDPLPEILPELSTFCNYVKHYYEVISIEECEHWVKLQHQYVLIQLLELCKSFDLADEMGRANLQKLCLNFLTNNLVSEDVVPIIVELMVRIIPDVEDRLQALAEAISEVREPMIEQEQESEPVFSAPSLTTEEFRQKELKQASIRVKINELQEDQDEAIRAKDFMKAQILKEEHEKLQAELKALSEIPAPSSPPPPPPPARTEIRDAVKDEIALCKCFRIVREMVQSKTVKNFSATLRSLMQNFVLPCLQQDNSTAIRNKALEALGLFCLLDKSLAQENFVMFCFQIANDEVCEVALKVTFDLLLLYGLETFQIREENGEASTKKKSKKKKNLFVTDMYDEEFDTEEEESQETHTSLSSESNGNTSNLISMLTSLLDSASTAMRNLAMEGLYKLLMACRISSSALLSRLILMWYSPVSEGDEALRQPLGAFLTMYSSHCPRSQETLEQAFLPTLRTLMQAPVTSPLTQIDQDSVARLFISLTRPGVNKFHSKVCHIHNNLATSICNEVMDCDDSTNIGVLLRGLSSLQLSLDDPVYRDELKTLVKRATDVFRTSKEKLFQKHLEKISRQIEMAAEDVSMRTTEVDNTAIASMLDGTQMSTNTVVTDITKAGAPSNHKKNDTLLHPNMHSNIDANAVADADEDDESSQETRNVIPPSPPRSHFRSSDEEEIVAKTHKGRKAKENGPNDVFKKPTTRARPARGRDREVTADSAPASDGDASPVPKRRKASEPDLRAASKSKTVENVKGLKKNNKPVSNSDGQSQGRHKTKETEKVVSERSPKRQINPTEKGATLKTFQNISPPKTQSPVKPSLDLQSGTPPAKRVRKNEREDRILAATSTSSPTRSSARRGVSMQSEAGSLDSPPASAAELKALMAKKALKNMRKKGVPEEPHKTVGSDVDSDASPVPTGRQTRTRARDSTSSPAAQAKSGSKSSQVSSAKSSKTPGSDSDASPMPSSRQTRTPKSSKTPGSDSDASPMPSSRQTRIRARDSSTSSPAAQAKSGSKSSQVSSAKSSKTPGSDSDASPMPPGRQTRTRARDSSTSSPAQAKSGSKSSQVSSAKSSKTPGSDTMPARATRKSLLLSDSEDLSPQPVGTSKASKSMKGSASSENDSQCSSSPMSAVDLANKLKREAKKADKSAEKTGEPSSARRSLRGANNQGPEANSQVTKKRPAKVLKSASSDGFSSESPASGSRASRGKTGEDSSQSTPTQPAKKTRTKVPGKGSPATLVPRRSLRTSNETPSPRTRTGKV
ncbi:hypothetical protein ONE63_001583 [Megalurothrips usitatus]|uniref:Nuclear condensin complex subunit 3 C-terminal domain-containing protein n=1 Tax=Megalurothrips usitatus TaxID=439358 RepID=A0AAV7XGM8_9NEOP|nr:hypothetical protein ONE63_001583 [Megalurothrips usitatus]